MDDEHADLQSSTAVNNCDTEVTTPAQRFKLSVEIPLFIAIMTASLTGAAVTNILLYRTCVHALHHTKDECIGFLSPDKTNATHDLEKEVQQYTTYVGTVKGVIESVAPAILSLFVAVWSDTHGRKPLLVWPIFGLAMTSMLMVVYAMLDDFGPWWYILTIVPLSLTGGFTVLFTGAYCYLSDTTSEEKRSIRMTILEASVGLGSVVGSLLSSYILRLVGHVYLLLLVAFLNVFAYVYTNVWIRESLTGAIRGGFTTIIDFLLVKEMIRECFKRRPNNGRAQILLLTFTNSLLIFIMYGLISLEYLYMRGRLHWAMKDYTIYSAATSAIFFGGSFIGVAVFQRLLGISDLAFANFGLLSMGVDFLTKTLCVAPWQLYLGSSLALFRGLSSPLIRSFLTKILPVTDIAKVFALMSALEGLCPLVAPILYNSLYQMTIYTFPASIYVLSNGIVLMCIVFTSMVLYYRRNDTPYDRL